MSLESRLNALIQAIGADIKALNAAIHAGGGSSVPVGYIEQSHLVQKASIASQAANTWVSLWRATGFPAQANIPAAAETCTNATLGAQPITFTAGKRHYMPAMTIANTNNGMLHVLTDRLMHMGGLSGTVTTAQTVGLDLNNFTGAAERKGAADLSEIDWELEWYTATGATAVTATVAVTYSDGSTGNLNAIALAASRPAGFVQNLREFIPTAKAGLGIRAVNSVTLSASTGTAGSFGVTASRTLWAHPTYAAAYPDGKILEPSQWVDVPDGACLYWKVRTSTTSSGAVNGYFKVYREA